MKILLFVILLLFVYQVVSCIYIYYMKQRFLKRNGLLKPSKSIALVILPEGENILAKYIENFNSKYIIIKVFLLWLMFFGGLGNYESIIIAGIFGVVGFLLPDIYLVILRKSKRNKVLLDLFNIVECLKLQLSSGIALKEAMREISNLCVDKDFKLAVQETSLRYELSEYNIGFAVMGLKKDFPYKEIEIFSSSLEGASYNPGEQDPFNNLNELLKENYLSNIEDNTKLKVFFIVIAVIIILIDLAMLGSFPIMVEIMQNFEQIFI